MFGERAVTECLKVFTFQDRKKPKTPPKKLSKNLLKTTTNINNLLRGSSTHIQMSPKRK